jgi:hypothetical protein
VQMPDEIPLPMPSGDVGALADLARDVGFAGRCLAAVDARLLGSATEAPGWLGEDAAAAAAQVGAVLTLIRAAADAMLTAVHQLDQHAERLLETRRRVAHLKDEQRDQFREAWRRWGSLPDLQMQIMIGSPAAQAIVHELEASEATRRRRHAALLEEIEDDAAATARVLLDSCATVGGRGRRGDATRVVAYLAAQLPGWSDLELARRGRALAAEFDVRPPEQWDARAEELVVFAGLPVFAGALLNALGQDGLRELLLLLGQRTFADDLNGRSSHVARFFGNALGAAARDPDGVADEVLSGTYVDADADGIDPDYVAMGMVTVLVAGSPNAGPAPMTVASWTRQVLAREHALAGELEGARAVDRVYPNAQFDGVTDEDSFRRFDPVPVLVGWLAHHGTAQSAAASLGDSRAWTVLLGRSWDDGGGALADLVSLAAAHPGATGARAAWSGLAAIGDGLVEGDPSDRTVDRDIVDAVAPALGDLVAAHVAVATSALADLGRGTISNGTAAVIRGLGYVTVDRGAADAVAAALEGWALVQPHDLTGTSSAYPLAAIAVPSTYVAVQQYGQRLAYALDEYEAQEAAEQRQRGWTVATVPLTFISGPAGIALGVAAGYAAIALDMDGTWNTGPDRGLFFDPGDAARAAMAGVDPGAGSDTEAVARQARLVYERAMGVLGAPVAPVSPEADLSSPLVGAVRGIGWDRLTRNHWGVQRVGGVLDSLFG